MAATTVGVLVAVVNVLVLDWLAEAVAELPELGEAVCVVETADNVDVDELAGNELAVDELED